MPRIRSKTSFLAATIFIGSVWVFHGLYSKILQGIPRHEMIVGRILGERFAEPATLLIGLFEVSVGLWVFSRRKRLICASVQTMALVSMNVLEIALATDLLISAAGMVVLNLAFLSFVWVWATSGNPAHLQQGARAK